MVCGFTASHREGCEFTASETEETMLRFMELPLPNVDSGLDRFWRAPPCAHNIHQDDQISLWLPWHQITHRARGLLSIQRDTVPQCPGTVLAATSPTPPRAHITMGDQTASPRICELVRQTKSSWRKQEVPGERTPKARKGQEAYGTIGRWEELGSSAPQGSVCCSLGESGQLTSL